MMVWFSCCGLIVCDAGFEVGLFWFVDWRIVIVYFCVLFDFWYYRFSVAGSVVGLCLGVGDLRCGWVSLCVCLDIASNVWGFGLLLVRVWLLLWLLRLGWICLVLASFVC